MQWYYAINGKKIGPISQFELERLYRMNAIGPQTYLWKQGMAQWEKLSELLVKQPDLITPAAPPLPAAIPPPMPAPVLSQPEPLGRGKEAAALNYAGFLLRLPARLIDMLILMSINMLVSNILTAVNLFPKSLENVTVPMFQTPGEAWAFLVQFISEHTHYVIVSWLISLIIALVYECYFIRRYSATPGKLALGLRLVRSDGSPLSTMRIIARHFADMLNGLTFNLTYLLIAVDEEKRGIHDAICDTRVIHK